MTENVVALYGGEVVQAAVPQDGVITALESMLERARAGEIQAIGIVCLHSDRLSSWGAAGSYNNSYSFIGACAKLFHTMCHADD